MLSRAAIVLMLAPSIAAAQTQTTDCTTDYFGNVHCTTRQQSGVNWGLLNTTPSQPNAGQSFINGWEQGQRMRAQIEAQRAARAQQQAAEQQAANEASAAQAAQVTTDQMHEAAHMIKSGDCAGAEQYALSVGNIPLAKEVKDYCSK
jgi:hypothetical protein